jgi:uncharacterized protein (TIGR02270 family)
MGSTSVQRAIGFAPAEISALVNEVVVSQHAEEAAFLWNLRNRAVGEPHYSLDDLAALDERVEAHLDGLRTAGDVGWNFCKANLELDGPGEVFAAAAIAFGAGDRARMLEALTAGCRVGTLRSGLISALGWLNYGSIGRWIDALLQAKLPAHRAIGIAACAIHRKDPGAPLISALSDDDPSSRARALRAVGELRRRDLLNLIRVHLQDLDPACRFWAAWSLAIHGDRDGLINLSNWVGQGEPFERRALELSLRCMTADRRRQFVSTLARDPRSMKTAVIGAGIVGDPVAISWLIRAMESPVLARLAGEAFTMITGVDLAYHDLNHDPPTASSEGERALVEEVLALDYESNLRWPSPTRVAQWWDKNSESFTDGTRYLAGRPINRSSALEVLVGGKQRQRAAAALELALMQPEDTLFETRARAIRQREQLAGWKS